MADDKNKNDKNLGSEIQSSVAEGVQQGMFGKSRMEKKAKAAEAKAEYNSSRTDLANAKEELAAEKLKRASSKVEKLKEQMKEAQRVGDEKLAGEIEERIKKASKKVETVEKKLDKKIDKTDELGKKTEQSADRAEKLKEYAKEGREGKRKAKEYDEKAAIERRREEWEKKKKEVERQAEQKSEPSEKKRRKKKSDKKEEHSGGEEAKPEKSATKSEKETKSKRTEQETKSKGERSGERAGEKKPGKNVETEKQFSNRGSSLNKGPTGTQEGLKTGTRRIDHSVASSAKKYTEDVRKGLSTKTVEGPKRYRIVTSDKRTETQKISVTNRKGAGTKSSRRVDQKPGVSRSSERTNSNAAGQSKINNASKYGRQNAAKARNSTSAVRDQAGLSRKRLHIKGDARRRAFGPQADSAVSSGNISYRKFFQVKNNNGKWARKGGPQPTLRRTLKLRVRKNTKAMDKFMKYTHANARLNVFLKRLPVMKQGAAIGLKKAGKFMRPVGALAGIASARDSEAAVKQTYSQGGKYLGRKAVKRATKPLKNRVSAWFRKRFQKQIDKVVGARGAIRNFIKKMLQRLLNFLKKLFWKVVKWVTLKLTGISLAGSSCTCSGCMTGCGFILSGIVAIIVAFWWLLIPLFGLGMLWGFLTGAGDDGKEQEVNMQEMYTHVQEEWFDEVLYKHGYRNLWDRITGSTGIDEYRHWGRYTAPMPSYEFALMFGNSGSFSAIDAAPIYKSDGSVDEDATNAKRGENFEKLVRTFNNMWVTEEDIDGDGDDEVVLHTNFLGVKDACVNDTLKMDKKDYEFVRDNYLLSNEEVKASDKDGNEKTYENALQMYCEHSEMPYEVKCFLPWDHGRSGKYKGWTNWFNAHNNAANFSGDFDWSADGYIIPIGGGGGGNQSYISPEEEAEILNKVKENLDAYSDAEMSLTERYYRMRICKYALQAVGSEYHQWDLGGPSRMDERSYDCSSFVARSYWNSFTDMDTHTHNMNGMATWLSSYLNCGGSTTVPEWSASSPMSVSSMKPGDILFPSATSDAGHVGLFLALDGGQAITVHATGRRIISREPSHTSTFSGGVYVKRDTVISGVTGGSLAYWKGTRRFKEWPRLITTYGPSLDQDAAQDFLDSMANWLDEYELTEEE